MARCDQIIARSEYQFRSPDFWRDLALGFFWGVPLVWASFDALHWATFPHNWWKELLFVALPLGLAMLSPRKLLVLCVGLSLPLFRFIFLIFVFHSILSALVVVAWVALLVLVFVRANAKYDSIAVPRGWTAVEFLFVMSALSISIFAAWKIHGMLRLG